MTRTQRIVTAALAAIILLWTPAQETWGQGNTPPVIDASPQFHHAATHQSEQRWELDTVIEIYEGPQANSELGKIILGSYDEENKPTEGQPDRISGITDALQIPWTSTTTGARTWTLGNRNGMMDSPKIKCKDGSGTTTHTWNDQGSQDSALFAIDQPQGDQQQGHIPLRFASTPDYEAAQDDGTNNEYLIRLVSGHDIHGLDGGSPTLGCDGSALDLKVRVKDVGPPAPPTGMTLRLQPNIPNHLDIHWDTPHANQFIEDGTRVDFPHDSFNVTSIVISHEPDGLQHRDNPLRNPSTLHARFGGIEHLKGTPGVTYTITTKLRNSEGDSTSVSEQITLPGPPATPEAPTVRPEGDTSVTAAWKEPDDDGGQTITGYEVQYQKDGAPAPAWETWPHTGTGTSAIIRNLDQMSEYHVQIKARNNLGASDWSPTGTGSPTASLIAQITSAGNITSGNDAVFTVTLSKAATATVTINFTHAWTGGYGNSVSGTLEFTDEISQNYTLPTDRGNPEEGGGSVTVTIAIDTNAAYAIGTGGSATVNIENVNEPPEFPSETDERSVTENTTAGQDIGTPVSATDPDTGETLTYTLDGTDAASFSIIATSGQLQTKADLDFEEKTSYTVTVTATDSSDASDTIRVTITVTDENEPPTVTGDSTINYAENGSQAVAAYMAADPESASITWSLSGEDSGDFSISNAGLLTFSSSSSPPDYEAPKDINSDNEYLVTVLASDGTNTTSLDITVTVTDENETPSVSGETSISYEENRTDTVATYTAEGPEGTSITWSLSVGDHSHHFSIRNDGTLTFNTPPDYETPGDADTNNVYLVEVQASNGPNTGTLDVTVNVTDENEPPSFAAETAARTIAENTAEKQNIGAPFLATDPDAGEMLIYTLDGTDATSFAIIESTGQLQTKADLDFEIKFTYTVTVTATDKEDLSDSIEVTITVTDVDEGPEVLGAPTRDYAENGTDPVATYTATNPENGQIAWSLLGEDSENFSINRGVLAFNAPPDYEAPADADTNNVYLVTVRAYDGNNADTLAVTVTITDKNEPPAFTEETATRTIAENTAAGQPIGDPFLATDPDDDETLTFTLGGTDAASFEIVPTTGQLQTKTNLDFENKASYTVRVAATDSSDASDTITVTITVTNENEPPKFPSTETGDRQVAENTVSGKDIGATVAAIDPDTGDTLTYTLEGEDLDSFDIDSASSQIQTKSGVTYDHESKSSYSVTVKADDNNGGTATIDVTITVADVNEPPEFSVETASRTIAENTTTGVAIGAPVTATDPDTADTPAYTLRGTNATFFDIDASTGQLQTKAPWTTRPSPATQ